MKKFFLILATILVATSSFAQTKEEISASADRAKRLNEYLAKVPSNTGIAEIDNYTSALVVAAVAAVENSEKLENFYYRVIGETKDGVTDVTIVKPALQDILQLSESIAAEAVSVAAAAKQAEGAAKKTKETKNPLLAAKLAAMTKFTADVAPLLGEESAAQVKAIAAMVETAKSASNL